MTTKTFDPDDRQSRIIGQVYRRAEISAVEGRHAPDGLVERMSQEIESIGANPKISTGNELQPRPTVFLDIDDVLSLNALYGGLDVQRAMANPSRAPRDLYQKLFSPVAVSALNELILEFNPRVVMTSSWTALLQREHFIDLFQKSGVSIPESSLHPNWDAQQDYGTSRLDAIESWLKQHHNGEPIVAIDDYSSGESLVESLWHESGHVVLCDVNGGFNQFLLQAARSALRKPFNPMQPWVK